MANPWIFINNISRGKGTHMLMKKTLVTAIFAGVAALVASSAALAAAPGFYVGGQLGYSDTHYGASDFANMTSAKTTTTGFAYRPFVGYQFNQNWAMEGGYTNYANAKFTSIVRTTGTLADSKVKQHAWDIVAKGMLPLDNGFGLYGKAGMAYVKMSSSDGMSVYSDVTKWRPTAGVGASYDFNQNVSVDVSFTRVFKGSGIQNSDFTAAGVSYHFG